MSQRLTLILHLCLCGLVFIGRATPSSGADFAVANRDEVLVLISKIQATQLLTHATFGTSQAEIDQLALEMRQQGTLVAAGAWIDRQTNPLLTPPSMQLATQEAMIGVDVPTWALTINSVPAGFSADASHVPNTARFRQHAWWHIAITGQDQLRQKMAWSLAQIFPVNREFGAFDTGALENSISGATTKAQYLGISNYYDLFVTHAFSKYREVLGRVTYHPIMGDWLSYRGNKRAQGVVFPDENFAREVMQLFSIGLYLLRDDGVPQTDAQGIIPTYDADKIREYAEVFTGLGYGYGTYAPQNTSLNPYSPFTGPSQTDPNGFLKYQVPMRMAPSQHDRSAKILLSGLTLNNANGADAVHTEATANAEIDAALDGLVNHQSCPPFIVHRLIQRFVKSNPSRSYTNRVVNVFKNNGQGQRGDLKAVIKAILLDPEAWQPIRVQYQRSPINKFIVTTMGTEDSRLQEPVMNYIRFTKFFKGQALYQRATNGFYVNPVLINNEFRLDSRNNEFSQSPYEMPSVFNFYLHDYQPSELVGIVPTARIPNGAVAAPEFQIVNAITSNSTGNFFRGRVVEVARTEPCQLIGTSTLHVGGILNTITESTRVRVNYDFSVEQGLAISPAGIDALVERLDLYLCGGTLGSQYKTTMRNALLNEIAIAGGAGNISTTESLNIAKAAILATVTSPCFLVTE